MSATARIACARRSQSAQVAGATSWIDTHSIGRPVSGAGDDVIDASAPFIAPRCG